MALLLLLAGSLAAAEPLDEALALLNPDEAPIRSKLAPWPAGGKNLWVVAGVYGRGYETIHVAVLRKTARGFEVVATNSGDEPLVSDIVYSYFIHLDLIPYRISPKEVTFGVRFSNTYNSTARSGSSNALYLYRMNGDTLTQVFSALTYVEDYDKREDTSEISTAVVIVSKRKHKGFYDLLLREKNPPKTTTYRWNGERYEAR